MTAIRKYILGFIVVVLVSIRGGYHFLVKSNVFEEISGIDENVLVQVDSEEQKTEQVPSEPVLTCVDPDDVTIDILMYHYVREEGWDPVSGFIYGNSIPHDTFTRHIQIVASLQEAKEIAITTMYELGEMLQEDCFMHEYLVVLTADDGWRDNYASMPEVMEYFGIPMVLGIPIDLLPAKGREGPFMNHEELMELLDSGLFEVQSHSLTHSVMSAISNESQIQEICGSKWKLEDQFRRPINTFIYPGGKYNSDVLKVVEECGYRFGLTTEFGTNTVSDLQKNPYRLKRTRITRELDLEEYFSIFNR